MNIDKLISGLPLKLVCGTDQTRISSIVEDSRLAEPDCLFIAREGTQTNGVQYIPEAIERGAAAIVANEEAIVPSNVSMLIAQDMNRITASLAERFYGSPSKSIRLIGVTGTNGKTTTAHLIHQLLNKSELRCGLIGTVQIDNGKNLISASLTTPSALDLSKYIQTMVDNGCKAAVIEVSSHALVQERVSALLFDAAIFTNLSGDHLDYHNSMDEYAEAKSKLFELLPVEGIAVLNIDDPQAEFMIRNCKARILRCTTQDKAADFSSQCKNTSIDGMDASFSGSWGKIETHLPLLGLHNLCNAMQASIVAREFGIPEDEIKRCLSSCSAPPGRLEPVNAKRAGFTVLVDYAHTDDALANVLRAVKPFVPDDNKLRVVFGCGGDRDKTKRPRMAQVALEFADELIITSDNPRTEDPQEIINDIEAGVPDDSDRNITCIVDRRNAIRAAVQQACPGDVVLIAGKGHEPYQIIGTNKFDFDDRVIATEAINELSTKVAVI